MVSVGLLRLSGKAAVTILVSALDLADRGLDPGGGPTLFSSQRVGLCTAHASLSPTSGSARVDG